MTKTVKTIKPSIKTWDKVSRNYSNIIDESEIEISTFLLDTFKKLKVNPSSTLIELGSGSGHISALLAQKKFSPTLLDFSQVAIKKSRLIFNKLKIKGEFIQDDIFNLDKIAPHDISWNGGVMEHFDGNNLDQVFKLISKNTKKYFIFIVPNSKSLPYLIWRFNLTKEDKWEYGKEYLRNNYEKFIEKNNFTLIGKEYLGWNISKWHFSTFIKNNIELNQIDKLINQNLIPQENAYLVAYICQKKDYLSNNTYISSSTTKQNNLTKKFDNLATNFKNDQKNNDQSPQEFVEIKQKILAMEKEKFDMQHQMEKEKFDMQHQLDEYFLILNKIYHSKFWKMLGYYKNFVGFNKNILKKVIPISLRKKLKSILEAKFTPEQVKNNIPPNVLKEWQNWNYGPRKDNSLDIINFSVIAWDFRFQRPQQLAKNLGDLNHRVFYIKNEFLPHNNSNSTFAPIKVEKKSKNVYEVTLSATRNLFIYNDIPSEKDKKIIIASVKNLINEAHLANPVAKFDHPFWANISDQLSMSSVYDCMDNHQGFSENGKHLSELENKLFQDSTMTLVTSKYLKNVATKNKAQNITLIPNAGDYQHFAKALGKSLEIPLDIQNIPHPIIGYYGALAEWFDTDILESIAKDHSDKSIVLIGNVTNQKINSLSKKYKNIYLLGEKSYQELPKYLKQFDVCTIPFILNDLIKATHPVKIFEYLAAGKPIITTKMPEILNMKEIYFADIKNFSSQITVALKNKQKNIKKRQQIAKDNTWDIRTKYLISNLDKILFPKISIILLSYNSCDMAKNTIDSVLTRTFYPNYELIIVDNKSDQQTVDMLKNYQSIPNVKLIFNNENYGFAKGNNIGLKEATGDYLILLNNDVLVIPGWLSRLLYHLQTTDNAGIVGPVTNSTGNEAKINIEYNPFEIKDLENKAYNYTSTNWGKTLNPNMVAAFCWIFSHKTYETVGELDENFGRGFFEDDDYCRRIIESGKKILITDDVFIHHFGGVSFKQIQSAEYQKLFNNNKAKFEEKWKTKWQPHQYRKIK